MTSNYTCESLKASLAERYEVLMNHATFGFILIDIDGNIIDINTMALSILGIIDPKHPLLDNVLSYMPFEESKISQQVRQTLGSQERIVANTKIVNMFKKKYSLRVSTTPILDTSDRICFCSILLEDTTQLADVEWKLKRANRVLIATVDGIPHITWCKDISGKYAVVNKAYLRFLGKELKEVIGKTDFDLFSQELAEQFRDEDTEALASCGIHVREKNILGSWFKVQKAGVCCENGERYGTVGIAIDINSEIQHEHNLAEAIDNLSNLLKKGKVVG